MKSLGKEGLIIRVYGLLINNSAQILLSDEYLFDQRMTKFPGGGMEPGEGPEDCLKREALEELGQEIEILEHFYTTGFYQKALFYENNQLISIYYKMKLIETARFRISNRAFDFENNNTQSFRWAEIKNFKTEDLTFPIDRHVMNLLKTSSI